MDSLAVIILAAGLGKRMGLAYPKVLVRASGKTLIEHVCATAQSLSPQRLIVVTGYQREKVEEVLANLGGIEIAHQKEALGTGNAVKSALPLLNNFSGLVLILYGDVPLIRPQTLQNLIQSHIKSHAVLSLITFHSSDGGAYGRVIRNRCGEIERIVEHQDCTPEELRVGEFNSGIYVVNSCFLVSAVNALKNNNFQGEYYLTDIVATAAAERHHISSITLSGETELLGVNTHYDLYLINKALMNQRIKELINAGVKVADSSTLWIDDQVEVQPGAYLGPNLILKGRSSIGAGVYFEGCAYLEDTTVSQNARIRFCVRCEGAHIGEQAVVGPFAHLRPGTVLEGQCRVGNFVEVKNGHLQRGVKASHLSYLGDCVIGAESNIGAGTITCNYDGYKKHNTSIGTKVFVGSNTCLVAPVSIGDGATIGAGSVITSDVESDALAISRAPQVNKPGWSKKKREIFKKER